MGSVRRAGDTSAMALASAALGGLTEGGEQDHARAISGGAHAQAGNTSPLFTAPFPSSPPPPG